MRGLCMLGVIGIHVGSYAISNPQANVYLIAVLEILSRFCVPAFFFLSAFGLFYHTPTTAPFQYRTFLKKRIQVVLYPYLVWSLFYILYSAGFSHAWGNLLPYYLGKALFFGNAYYHLYFMVILLWFYLLMPFWRYMVKKMLPHSMLWLTLLFILQTAFNFWSSYQAGSIFLDNSYLQYAFQQRLNYWVLHYVWIFLLGAIVAEKYEQWVEKIWSYRLLLTLCFMFSVLLMLGSYFYVMYEWKYSLLSAIYTIHQLSPMGMFYTGTGCLFFLFFFQSTPMSSSFQSFWYEIGQASYGIYLIHPLMLLWLTSALQHFHYLFTASIVVGLYSSTIALSYIATISLREGLPPKLRRIILGT